MAVPCMDHSQVTSRYRCHLPRVDDVPERPRWDSSRLVRWNPLVLPS